MTAGGWKEKQSITFQMESKRLWLTIAASIHVSTQKPMFMDCALVMDVTKDTNSSRRRRRCRLFKNFFISCELQTSSMRLYCVQHRKKP